MIMKAILPQRPEIAPWVGSSFNDQVLNAVSSSLLAPLEEFLSRPGKQFRSMLVRVACTLALKASGKEFDSELEARCEGAARIIEAIHAGALIVDDIQDGSRVRRNGPTLHLSHGVAKALNAGNWLYFWPLHELRSLGLSPERELELYRDFHEILVQAHFGQAIDVGTRIDEIAQSQVPSLCIASLELKTGALMALAMRLGAHIGGATPDVLQSIGRIGKELGVLLQAYDDVGNFAASGAGTIPESKRYEDLLLRRPSWVWAVAARELSEADYARWKHAVGCLPDESFLKPWIELNDLVPRLRSAALDRSRVWNKDLDATFGFTHPEACKELKSILSKLEQSYG
jgi:geranylgeranyl pyrophosphate synthase